MPQGSHPSDRTAASAAATTGAISRHTLHTAATPQRTTDRSLDNVFQSFWMGGFESACHINSARCRLDMIAVTHHDRCADEDYALLRSMNMLTARDGVRWHL